MQIRKSLSGSVAAGLFIGIGGAVFLSSAHTVTGAVFFTVALLCICQLDLLLYTGKIGFLVFSPTGGEIGGTALCLLGNAVGTGLAGMAIRYCRPALTERASVLVSEKLTLPLPQVFFAAVFCGILMYAAVRIYREKKSISGILFCVPVFILSGFEHSIADMFYFWMAQSGGWRTIAFLSVVVGGNTVGGMLIPLCKRLAGERS